MGNHLRNVKAGYLPLALLAIALAAAPPAQASELPGQIEAALDRYVLADDSIYSYEVLSESVSEGLYSVTTLRLLSQQWQGTPWSHYVTIYQPVICRQSGPVTVLVDGGTRPSKDVQGLSAITIATQTPIVILGSVPNQPLYGLREDALIAYTFAKYLETGDETWPLLFPMTKSVVSCMDALESYFASQGRFTPDGFIIAGGSKRGWTSWLSGAVDSRVVGIIPIVYDNLNLKAQMENQLATWGEYSPQIHDYTDLGLQGRLESLEGSSLAEIVDPYTYLDRLQIPKLIVIGSNDPYWPLGAVNLYFDDLQGDNYLLMMPNTGHSTGDVSRLFPAVIAFQRHVAGLDKLPSLSWDFSVDEEKGVARATIDTPPDATIQFWQASSNSMDFRKSTWTLAEEQSLGPVAEFELPLPEIGMRAVFADISIKLPSASVTLTTTPFIY